MTFTTLEQYILSDADSFKLKACYEDIAKDHSLDKRFFCLDYEDRYGLILRVEYDVFIPFHGITKVKCNLLEPDEIKPIEEEIGPEWKREEVSYDLCHNYIWGGVRFAEKEGLRPHMNFYIASKLLKSENDPSVEKIPVSFGLNGKHVITLVSPVAETVYTRILRKNLPKNDWMAMPDKEWVMKSGYYSDEAKKAFFAEYEEEDEYDFYFDRKVERLKQMIKRDFLWKDEDMEPEVWFPKENNDLSWDNPYEFLNQSMNSFMEEEAYLNVFMFERPLTLKKYPSSVNLSKEVSDIIYRPLSRGVPTARMIEKVQAMDKEALFKEVKNALWFETGKIVRKGSHKGYDAPGPRILICLELLAETESDKAREEVFKLLRHDREVLNEVFKGTELFDNIFVVASVFVKLFLNHIDSVKEFLLTPFIPTEGKVLAFQGLVSLLDYPLVMEDDDSPDDMKEQYCNIICDSDKYDKESEIFDTIYEIAEAYTDELNHCRPHICSSNLALYIVEILQKTNLWECEEEIRMLISTDKVSGYRNTEANEAIAGNYYEGMPISDMDLDKRLKKIFKDALKKRF